jgi:hypothetical protein
MQCSYGSFVVLLHELGAHKFARQYEWSTWKSQPNLLKRIETNDDPRRGLTVVDFRAGLMLLPFVPVSPADLKLILQGSQRGVLVQFDRGDLNQLAAFVRDHQAQFTDLMPLFSELRECERLYRDSMPDVTHNVLRLFFDKSFRNTIASSAIAAWCIQDMIDDSTEKYLYASRPFLLFFFLLGLIPFLGAILRKVVGRTDYRSHYLRLLHDISSMKRTFLAKRIESLLGWHRDGRVTVEKAVISSVLNVHVPDTPAVLLSNVL